MENTILFLIYILCKLIIEIKNIGTFNINLCLTKKRDCYAISLVFWVKKGARTLDPRNHNPML